MKIASANCEPSNARRRRNLQPRPIEYLPLSSMTTQFRVILIALLLLVVTASVSARLFPQGRSCRARSDVAGKCFTVHGRLSVYNGTPSIRLWPIGTKRLLGIIDPNDASNAP